jgi:cell division protein FtsL
MLRRLNWLLMLATLTAAFALYAVKYDTRRLEARVQAQERALEKAENDVAILMAERTHLARPERLEPLARLIGLAPVTPAQYLRVGPTADAARTPSLLADEGRGGGKSRTPDVATPLTTSPSPHGGEEVRKR